MQGPSTQIWVLGTPTNHLGWFPPWDLPPGSRQEQASKLVVLKQQDICQHSGTLRSSESQGAGLLLCHPLGLLDHHTGGGEEQATTHPERSRTRTPTQGCEQAEAITGSSRNSRALPKSVRILSPQQSSQLLEQRRTPKHHKQEGVWVCPNRTVSHAAEECSLRLMGKVLRCPQPCCPFGDGTWVPPALLLQEQFSGSMKQEGGSPQPRLTSPRGYKTGFGLCKLRTRLLLPPGGMGH